MNKQKIAAFIIGLTLGVNIALIFKLFTLAQAIILMLLTISIIGYIFIFILRLVNEIKTLYKEIAEIYTALNDLGKQSIEINKHIDFIEKRISPFKG